MIGCI